MARTDVQGRVYAKVADLKAGDRVEVDGGFTCMKGGTVLTVLNDDSGELFLPCSHGGHYMAGQLAAGGSLIGIYPANEEVL